MRRASTSSGRLAAHLDGKFERRLAHREKAVRAQLLELSKTSEAPVRGTSVVAARTPAFRVAQERDESEYDGYLETMATQHPSPEMRLRAQGQLDERAER